MTDGAPLARPAELRHRLLAMRAELVEQMTRDRIEGGSLTLLAGINAAIEACEAAAEAPDTVPAGRAVVSDDGEAIRLTLYSEAVAVSAVTLAPRRTVALASDLLSAALLRLRAP